MALLFDIAGVCFSVSDGPEASLLHNMPGFPHFMVQEGSPRYEVRFGSICAEAPAVDPVYRFHFSDTDVDCAFGRNEGSYWFQMVPRKGAEFLLTYAGGRVIEASHCLEPSMLRFALWIAYCMMGSSEKRVPIHSSVVVNQGRAVLCLGESGTGKSTHTRLWLNHIPGSRLLNDDSPILYLHDGVVMVSGSPWSGKTPCFHKVAVPVAAFVRIKQAPYNKIQRLPVLNAFSALFPSFPPALAHDEVFTDRFTEILSDIIGCVPVFRLECLPDADAARTSFEAIFPVKP